MEGAGINGFQGLLLWEEEGFAVLAWQRECQEEQQLFPSSLDVCWCLWITGAWGAGPGGVQASLPMLVLTLPGAWGQWGGGIWGHLCPCAAHAKRREVFPPLLGILVNYLECGEGLNMS